MRFRVLGPVEVLDEAGAARPAEPPKRRVLLAALLARRGARMSTGQLVDVLWGADPPRSALANVQTYVWELRRRLPPTRLGRPRVARDRDGYRLHLDDGDLDAARFTELAERGRRALVAADPASGARLLTAALQLWRGEPFEDVVCAVPLAARQLVEQRQLAREDLLDARLRLGEHREVVDELYLLTAADPLRERPWTLLMLALYRCGRRAEALHTYRQVYDLLDAELGIAPGAPLRDLQRQILAGDAELDQVSQSGYTASPA